VDNVGAAFGSVFSDVARSCVRQRQETGASCIFEPSFPQRTEKAHCNSGLRVAIVLQTHTTSPKFLSCNSYVIRTDPSLLG
jgi:hypothetical protein